VVQPPTKQPRSLALEALLYDLEINAEQVSTAGEKECFMSISLGREVRIILGYNTHEVQRPLKRSVIAASSFFAISIRAFVLTKVNIFRYEKLRGRFDPLKTPERKP
jgi:hypothetical protein